jgi:segregation and condensation protein A
VSNAPEPLDPSFQLKLPAFEGPLDLLLYLVQKHDLEILDLPVAFVTERYLEHLGVMQQLNLDIAAEYLVMAATLAYIKSKMLLPPDPSAAGDEENPEEEIDPRAELIRRLLEYQKYKQAAEDLASRGMAGRDVFLRGMEAPEALGEAPLASFGLFKLLDAFKAVLERNQKASSFAVTHEGITIHDRMRQLVDRLAQRRSCSFDELFDDARTTYDLVVTFLAILEMAKRRLARVYQSEPIAPIHLEYTVLVEGDAEQALEAPTTADGEVGATAEAQAEAQEAALDEAVARAGEDPLGPALDSESEDEHSPAPPGADPSASDDE